MVEYSLMGVQGESGPLARVGPVVLGGPEAGWGCGREGSRISLRVSFLLVKQLKPLLVGDI